MEMARNTAPQFDWPARGACRLLVNFPMQKLCGRFYSNIEVVQFPVREPILMRVCCMPTNFSSGTELKLINPVRTVLSYPIKLYQYPVTPDRAYINFGQRGIHRRGGIHKTARISDRPQCW